MLPTPAKAKAGATEEIIDLNETPPEKIRIARNRLLVLVDRLAIKAHDESNLSRIADSVEQAFRESQGQCIVHIHNGESIAFSEYFERDGLRFEEPTPHLFSFNNPVGACPECQGFGRIQGIDRDLVIPDSSLSIRQTACALTCRE